MSDLPWLQEEISWDQYHFEDTKRVARKAKDPSRKTGAIAVRNNIRLMTGFCGFPIGVNDRILERYTRENKNLYTAHAEFNVIALSARKGVALEGATLYSNLHPCYECAKLIIQAGFVRVVCKKLPPNPIRNEIYRFDIAREAMLEAGIEITEIDDGNGELQDGT